MPRLTHLPGLNIQWPISEEILLGTKSVETRNYPVPTQFLNTKLLLVETPGQNGNFKARLRGVILIESCFLYDSEKDFYNDYKNHRVSPSSPWAWTKGKRKWGWNLKVVEVFDTPKPCPSKKGIIFTKSIGVSL